MKTTTTILEPTEATVADQPARLPATIERDPMQLVQLAIERGTDADQLGKLMSLVEDYQSQRAKRAFAIAFNAAQREMPRIVRDKKGAKGNIYSTLETIYSTIGPIITKHGFSISWGQGDAKVEGDTRVIATLMHIDGHFQEYIGDYPIDGKGAKGGDVMTPLQGIVSSHTYAQRDMMRMMFSLVIADVDEDGASPLQLIGRDAVLKINTLLDEIGGATDAFFEWLSTMPGHSKGMRSLEKVTQANLPKIVEYLKRKLAQVEAAKKPVTAKGGAK